MRTMQGSHGAAVELPGMRCIEVVVHAVDLDADVGLPDVDEQVQVQAAICEEVFGVAAARRDPDVVVFAGDRAVHRHAGSAASRPTSAGPVA